MRYKPFFKILLLFLLLLTLEICFSFILIKLFYYEDMVYLSIDLSHLIIIFFTIKIWKINVKELFKKIGVKYIIFLMLIGLLLTLIYPILNIPNLITSSLNNQTGLMKPNLIFSENNSFNFSKLYYLLRTLLVMPFLEEILFRGIIQNKLNERYSAFLAITFSSLFFALGHMEYEQSIVVFFTGMIIGLIYHKSKNLTSVVLLHVFINSCFLFIKIEYVDSVDIWIFIYHFALIGFVFIILKGISYTTRSRLACINMDNIIEITKILVYKENPLLFEKLDFNNNDVFLEPLLFAYFNSKSYNLLPKEALEEILQGYFKPRLSIKIKYSYDKKDIAYIPSIGYFKKGNRMPSDPIKLISNTIFEIITHQIKNLKYIFRDFNEQPIEERKITISKELVEVHEEPLTIALSYIKKYTPNHYNLIEQCCKKILLFKTDPKNTNSFATINAHGMAFLNVFQKEYDEVFFVDDIAHQTGHIIMTTLTFKRKDYFLIDENLNIKSIVNNPKEYRSFYILFHALYTYYTTILCLDNCISNNCFDKRQAHEAIGRIGFYLVKYNLDINTFNNVIKHYDGIEKVLTKKGVSVFEVISDMYIESSKKYGYTFKEFSYRNQPYNFTYKKFIKLNPIKNS